jgi:hypothetical protein
MSNRTVVVPAGPNAQPSDCGCAATGSVCCSLDCLVQPRFFCGQLLTDQDLTALLTWTQEKLRLARYRHGWGVVCGLDVRCDCQQAGNIIVGPGYAVSCCGDDIIVCEDTSFSLVGACQPETDPCATLKKPAAAQGPVTTLALATESLPAAEVRVADLFIKYKEVVANPQTALARSICTQAGPCDYSRTNEGAELSWQVAISGSDPVTAAAQRWRDGYDQCVDLLRRFRETFSGPTRRGDQTRTWLVNWIDAHPLRQFCYLRDWICSMSVEQLSQEENLAKILFWLVQDCRNAYLACGCYDCQDGQGVPLARIWLRTTKDQRGISSCSIQCIDSFPPYRRPIGPACWPAPLGSINVGQVIWHRPEDACTTLAALGVRVAQQVPYVVPATLDDLMRDLTQDAWVVCGADVAVHILAVPELDRRVVGVTRAGTPTGGGSHAETATTEGIDQQQPAPGPAPETPPAEPAAQPQPAGTTTSGPSPEAPPGPPTPAAQALGLSLSADMQEYAGRPGETVTPAVTVTNTVEVPVRVLVQDDVAGRIAELWLAGGDTHAFRFSYPIPQGAAGEQTHQVTVTGTAEDGRTTRETMQYVVKVTAGAESGEAGTGSGGGSSDLRAIVGLKDEHAQILSESGINTHQDLAATPMDRLRHLFRHNPDVNERKLQQWQDQARKGSGT